MVVSTQRHSIRIVLDFLKHQLSRGDAGPAVEVYVDRESNTAWS